jgi:hypothetical protein
MNARKLALAHQYASMTDRVIGELKTRSCARDLRRGPSNAIEHATIIYTRTPRGLFDSIGSTAVHS